MMPISETNLHYLQAGIADSTPDSVHDHLRVSEMDPEMVIYGNRLRAPEDGACGQTNR